MSSSDPCFSILSNYLCEDIDSFKINQISLLRKRSFSIPSLNNNFRELMDSAYNEYMTKYKTLSPRPSSASFNWSDLNKDYILKSSIGSVNGLGEPYAQLLQTLYMPNDFNFINNNPGHLNTLGLVLVLIRNLLCDLPPSFGYNPSIDGFWNSTRIHHYPCGGGFMLSHRDTAFPKALEKSKIKFLQVSASLSVKGLTYMKGGGFVKPSINKKVYTDRTVKEPATLTLFDGSIVHGVDDIDKDLPFSFDQGGQRVAMFAGLYPLLQ